MKMLDNIKQIFTKNDEGEYNFDSYEHDEYVDEDEETEEVERPSFTPRHINKNMQVIIIKPVVFDDGKNIVSNVRNNHPVIINFEETDAPVAKRIIDFLSGASFALEGQIVQIGTNIFLAVPNSVSVDKGEQSYAEISDSFVSWKEHNL